MSKTTPVKTDPQEAPVRPVEVELSVVIPCLNEAQTIGTCIGKARRALADLGVEGEVIVADNGSTDDSVALSRGAGARVVDVPQRGYGSALMHGCEAARGRFILIGDGDDSYDFSEIGPFLEMLREGSDLVMGTRLRGTILPGAMPWKNRYIGNPLLTRVLRWLFGAKVSDAHCGMRALTRAAYDRMSLRSPGMEFASEMVIRAARLGLRIDEVPITFHADGRGRPPHLRPWRDGWRHIKLMLLFSPTALFLIPGLVLSVVGAALMVTQVLGPADRAVRLLGLELDFHWALVGSLLWLVGYQIITIHFFARIYSVTHRLREESRVLARAFRVLTLGRVLTVATVVILAGLAIDGVVVVQWLRTDFGSLLPGHTRLLIFGSTLVALGVQTFFNAFFFSILGDAYKYGTAPDRLP